MTCVWNANTAFAQCPGLQASHERAGVPRGSLVAATTQGVSPLRATGVQRCDLEAGFPPAEPVAGEAPSNLRPS